MTFTARRILPIANSEDPFDRWFRDHARQVHGVALEEGFTPPEQILDFRSEP